MTNKIKPIWYKSTEIEKKELLTNLVNILQKSDASNLFAKYGSTASINLFLTTIPNIHGVYQRYYRMWKSNVVCLDKINITTKYRRYSSGVYDADSIGKISYEEAYRLIFSENLISPYDISDEHYREKYVHGKNKVFAIFEESYKNEKVIGRIKKVEKDFLEDWKIREESYYAIPTEGKLKSLYEIIDSKRKDFSN